MKHYLTYLLVTLVLSQTNISTARAQPDFWVTAYLASWTLNMGPATNGNYGNLPYENIDLDAMTHLIMFALAVDYDGTIYYNNLVSSRRKPFNDYVHSHGKTILISVGGAGNTAFTRAINDTHRVTFIANLLAVLDTEQYDGIDLDMEPISPEDTVDYKKFVNQLWDSLQTRRAYWDTTRIPLLTAAILPSWEGEMFVGLESRFDQINIMTYDMGGTWFGKTWHNNGIYSRTNGIVNEADEDVYGVEMTTIEKRWNQQLGFGGTNSKYGIGIDFYGYVWTGGNGTSTGGVTAPRQTWNSTPSVLENVNYPLLRENFLDTISSGNYHWDSTAKVPYLSVDKPGSAEDVFVSFTDELACSEMVAFARNNTAGGIILWELGGGYLSASYENRDRLVQAVKAAVDGGTVNIPAVPIQISPANGENNASINPVLSWMASAGASSYRIQAALSPTFTSPVIDQAGIPDTNFPLSGLSANTTYYWRANASNSFGTSSWSSTWHFTTTVIPAIRGTVYFDANGNGTPDDGEPGMSGWRIFILGTLGGTAISDPNGGYRFDNLTWGTYTVGQYSKASWTQTDPTSPTTYTATLDTNNPVFVADFGNYSPTAFSFPVIQQWNIVSLPIDVFDKTTSAVFPTASTGIFAFRNQIYTEEEALTLGSGYWVKFNAAQSIWLAGSTVTAETIDVENGWNIIGGRSTPVSAAAVTSIPAGLMTSSFFGYEKGFTPAETLQPGRGYWIEVGDQGKLVLPVSTTLTSSSFDWSGGGELNTLRITDATGHHQTLYFGVHSDQRDAHRYELPPLPPSGVFDVRFQPTGTGSHGSLLREIPTGEEAPSRLPIRLHGILPPLTLAWDVSDPAHDYSVYAGGHRLLSMDGEGTSVVALHGSTELEIEARPPDRERLPSSFMIIGNYPNPFNPGTTIIYSLPEDAFVRLDVFNLLGEKVSSLAEGRLNAGRHTVRFDAPDLPGGVYIVRMNARSDGGIAATGIHRLLLLK